MRRAVKVRLYPTPEQETLFARTAGAAKKAYNLGLGVRKDAYEQDGLSVSTNDLMKMLPLWKEEFPYLAEVSSVVLQQALRNLDTAYKNFFEACKGDGKARFPRFKTRNSRVSFRLTKAGFRVKGGQLLVAKSKDPVLCRDRNYTLPENATSVTISRDASGRWFASFLVDDVVPLPETAGTKAVGIDLGVKSLAVTSDGEEFANPKHFDRHARRLAKYQRMMARRAPKPGQNASSNYRKAQRKAARVHAKIADSRRDAIHKVTTDLVERYDVIVIEDLNVSGLIKSKRMSRSIADTAWGEFRRQLVYKAGSPVGTPEEERVPGWYGKKLVVIDRFSPTSKTCSACGDVKRKLMLSEREWACTGCGTLHDRDLNAAKNIVAAGLAVLSGDVQDACGGSVRPSSSDAGGPDEAGKSPRQHPVLSAA